MDELRKSYTHEQKLKAVTMHVEDGFTAKDSMRRIGCRSKSAFFRWCAAYRELGPEALEPKKRGRPKGSGKRREGDGGRPMKRHALKLAAPYCDPVARGSKTFELRVNDRDYRVADLIDFEPVGEVTEWARAHFMHHTYQITYLLTHDDFPEGVPEGWCAFSIKHCYYH